MKLTNILSLLNEVVLKNAAHAVDRACAAPESYSKSAAYRLYGRTNVDRWIAEGLISIINKKLDRRKLEAISACSNRHTYLPVAER